MLKGKAVSGAASIVTWGEDTRGHGMPEVAYDGTVDDEEEPRFPWEQKLPWERGRDKGKGAGKKKTRKANADPDALSGVGVDEEQDGLVIPTGMEEKGKKGLIKKWMTQRKRDEEEWSEGGEGMRMGLGWALRQAREGVENVHDEWGEGMRAWEGIGASDEGSQDGSIPPWQKSAWQVSAPPSSSPLDVFCRTCADFSFLVWPVWNFLPLA